MNNLAKKNTSDFTVLDNGDAFISQRKVASLVGVSQQAVNQFCLSNNLLVKHGVNSENLSLLVTNYAQKGKPEAIQTLILFSKAGAKAYIYHEAGYVMQAAEQAKVILPDFTSPAIAARAWADEVEQKLALQEQAKVDAPKIEFAMAVRNMDGICSIGDFAKTIGTGRNRLFRKLREDMVLMENNIPYQGFCDRDLFVVIEQIPTIDKKGKSHPSFTTMVTGKGQVWLEKKYRDIAA